MDKITLNAPAKINLYLKITGKRPDGYHDLRTIFQSVSLFDEVSIEKKSGGLTVECDNPEIPGGKDNLAFKAASLVFLAGGASYSACIKIKKKIPVLAGLGGGSGNAAAVINGLDTLFEMRLSDSVKKDIGVKCGADVPFMLKGGTALGEGIGEKLKYLKPVKGVYFVLVNPGVKKPSTKEIYRNFRMELTNNGSWDNNITEYLAKGSITGDDISSILYNDLESVTKKFIPAVSEIKQSLLSLGSLGAMMTGSGPTVFGVYCSEPAAKSAEEVLRRKYSWVCVAESYC